jgi:hypothetical protein
LKDEPLGTGRDLLEPERSLVAGPESIGVWVVPDFPVFPTGTSLCKQIDNTISTFGAGPRNIQEKNINNHV